MIRTLITAPLPGRYIDRFRGLSEELEIEQYRLTDGIWPEDMQTQAEIIYAGPGLPRPEQAPRLRWTHLHQTNLFNLRLHPIWDTNIILTTDSGAYSVAMAQYVMSQILLWANRVPNWFKVMQVGTWPSMRRETYSPRELRSSTVGILGYGGIGREVARLAKSFGMKVLVTKHNLMRLERDVWRVPGTGDSHGDLPDRIYPDAATASMVAECDFVVVALPLTEKTLHLVGEDILRQMKPHSFVIQLGRGGVIDEAALIKALKRGWIGGAGMDAFEEEPLPDSSPFWHLENVILTPNISALSSYSDDRACALFSENLRRYLAGDVLLSLVDRNAGY